MPKSTLRTDTSLGTVSTVAAKLRIDLIPAATSSSAARCADAGGVAITPILTLSLLTINNRSSTCRTTTPPTLQAHGGKVALSLDATFAEKYFAKKATVDFTPVLVYNGGETAFKTITIQGEEATGGEATIFNATGGSFKYNDAISYSDEMMSSTLELRAVAKQKDKEKKLREKKQK